MPRKPHYPILAVLNKAYEDHRKGGPAVAEALSVLLADTATYPHQHVCGVLAYLATHGHVPKEREFAAFLGAAEATVRTAASPKKAA